MKRLIVMAAMIASGMFTGAVSAQKVPLLPEKDVAALIEMANAATSTNSGFPGQRHSQRNLFGEPNACQRHDYQKADLASR